MQRGSSIEERLGLCPPSEIPSSAENQQEQDNQQHVTRPEVLRHRRGRTCGRLRGRTHHFLCRGRGVIGHAGRKNTICQRVELIHEGHERRKGQHIGEVCQHVQILRTQRAHAMQFRILEARVEDGVQCEENWCREVFEAVLPRPFSGKEDEPRLRWPLWRFSMVESRISVLHENRAHDQEETGQRKQRVVVGGCLHLHDTRPEVPGVVEEDDHNNQGVDLRASEVHLKARLA
mmetsp:Transcript_124539/g.265533  ORF Transcript_124539/g.265533 Transcript_124539/m.265533 type:complete len:233 (-) Transcript_124539:733-1431(-)